MKEDAAVIAVKEEQHRLVYKEQLMAKRRMGRMRLRPTGPRKPEIAPDDGTPTLSLVVKTDVDGTLEAILNVLSTYELTDCCMEIVHFGVGAVGESDVEIAEPFGGKRRRSLQKWD